MTKALACISLTLALAGAALGVERRFLLKSLDENKTAIAALKSRNSELLMLSRAQGDALARIQAEAAAQAERAARAATTSSRARTRSEARVREILVAPAPDDTRELVEWAVLEAQKLNDNLRGAR